MSRTLKSQYIEKKRMLIEQKVRAANKQLLRENYAAKLIMEAMDENDLKVATQIINKLRKMKKQGLDELDSGISAAEADINKYLSGGNVQKAKQKLMSMVGFSNPLVKIMTLANALETGFKQIPTIIKNSLDEEQLQDPSKSILDVLNDENKKNVLVKNIRKALAPQGIFGTFGKIPYVKTDALSVQIVSCPLGKLLSLVKVIESGPKSADISKDIKDIANSGNGPESREPEGGNPAKETTGSAIAGNAGKSTTGTRPATGEGEAPPPAEAAGSGNTGKLSNDDVMKLAQSIKVGNNDDIIAALHALNDKGHLKK